ncbi:MULTISPECIES: VOC family protein [unclassified Bradyrhizobium]|jgi:catechol 2,3-dioxygenase-like lactoylglutathione lyase family enzyme|uniref:VOC family protein n=1 Tax=unclassified Bradyrhizobium TaxID=2631580 RepID=UPI00025D2057|nr:VOC family protein [Bradyrhizobium sp. WSM1253]EIG60388.1 lactoylglutathione lyase family protein [Bradyrhizobium sp. WSM1253]
MRVKRIVTNIAAADVSLARRFYQDVLGLEIVMDQGWIATFAAQSKMAPQLSIATEGGSGTPVPDLSIEVDDLDEALRRMERAGVTLEYGPATEPWGVRRFYVRDPFGRLVNILAHE